MGRVYSSYTQLAERQAIPGRRGARLLDQNDAKIMIMIFVNINRIPGASYTTSIYIKNVIIYSRKFLFTLRVSAYWGQNLFEVRNELDS